MKNVTITLTEQEHKALKEKLEWLMREANGVDIWLAPGGVLDVNDKDTQAECFLDCDEEAHDQLVNVLEKLGGEAQRHKNMISIAITHLSPGMAPVLEAMTTKQTKGEAKVWVKEHLDRWIAEGKETAKLFVDGEFKLDGFGINVDDVQFVTANKGEEMFIASFDRETAEEL